MKHPGIPREEWEMGWIEAHIAYCGEDCECYQPIIEEFEPDRKLGYPVMRRTVLWRGKFLQDPTPTQLNYLRLQLTNAAKHYGIELDQDFYAKQFKRKRGL